MGGQDFLSFFLRIIVNNANDDRIEEVKSDFEETIKQAGFEELLNQAKQEVGSSKARIGRYITENIPKEKIPKEFVEVIDSVIKISSSKVDEIKT